ncbi:MAG: ATP-binding protein [Acidimicrobiia bacterium]
MRQRILIAFIAFSVLLIAALGVPLGLVGTRLVHDQAVERLQQQAFSTASSLDREIRADPSALDESLVEEFTPDDHQVEVRTVSGGLFKAGDDIEGAVLSRLAPINDEASVRVSTSRSALDARTREVWLIVTVVGIAALVGAVLIAVFTARRLTSPLDTLVDSAERLGAGQFDVRTSPTGLAEIDKVGSELDMAAARIGALLSRERAFAENASHQLRSVITALRIRVEELATIEDRSDLDDEIDTTLRVVDRLEGTVEELLALSQSGRIGDAEVVGADDLIHGCAERFRPVFAARGRVLVVDIGSRSEVRVNPAAVGQALDALVDNSLQHGAGTVVMASGDQKDSVVLRVSDEGSGIADDARAQVFRRGVSLSGSSGLGLPIAREIVELEHGRLVLTSGRPPVFEIYLPRAREAAR